MTQLTEQGGIIPKEENFDYFREGALMEEGGYDAFDQQQLTPKRDGKGDENKKVVGEMVTTHLSYEWIIKEEPLQEGGDDDGRRQETDSAYF